MIKQYLKPQYPDHLIDRDVARIRNRWRDAQRAYAGGLRAERQSQRAVCAELRSQLRAAVLRGRGRPLDLPAILAQRDERGRPRWCLVDPTAEATLHNGGCLGTSDGMKFTVRDPLKLPGRYRGHTWVTVRWEGVTPRNAMVPTAIPPLPPDVRGLATDPAIRRRANFVGILCQPEGWREIDPDPALVVEWRDRPGSYYCLAVWGEDRGIVEEFYRD